MQTAYLFRIQDPQSPKMVQILAFVWIDSRSKIKEWGLFNVSGKAILWESPIFQGEQATVSSAQSSITFLHSSGNLSLHLGQPIPSAPIGSVGSFAYSHGVILQAHLQHRAPYTEKAYQQRLLLS